MKLSEMVAKKNGLPDGFVGSRAKWTDINEPFQIMKAAVLERPAYGEDGAPLVYSQGPREGQPIMDRQLAMSIKTRSGKEYIIRTNSRRLVSLFTGDLDREPDMKNTYGDSVYNVEPPEGDVRFCAFKYEYSNGQRGDIADLEEAED